MKPELSLQPLIGLALSQNDWYGFQSCNKIYFRTYSDLQHWCSKCHFFVDIYDLTVWHEQKALLAHLNWEFRLQASDVPSDFLVGSPIFLVKTHLQTSTSDAALSVGYQHRHGSMWQAFRWGTKPSPYKKQQFFDVLIKPRVTFKRAQCCGSGSEHWFVQKTGINVKEALKTFWCLSLYFVISFIGIIF